MERQIPKLTPKDRLEMAKEKQRNMRQRMEFVDLHAEWLRKTPNKVWSKQQKVLLDP
ncbi:MAG: hypothetical protein J4203_07005 [Candidatus Diapherotrites archaeon]|uniref:Uncharacterized protein n=1 Tax=Candidatus Iainarchaeum sp. TaxID=3101447 RepID=A0A8T4LCA1_9ARCH|nr:hypothetical protein [Candidatus Diapherotrites archaeon]